MPNKPFFFFIPEVRLSERKSEENQVSPLAPRFIWPKFKGRAGKRYRPSVCLTLVLFIKHLDGLRSGYKDPRRPSLSRFLGVQSSANSCRRRHKAPIRETLNPSRRYFVPLGPPVVAFVL